MAQKGYEFALEAEKWLASCDLEKAAEASRKAALEYENEKIQALDATSRRTFEMLRSIHLSRAIALENNYFYKDNSKWEVVEHTESDTQEISVSPVLYSLIIVFKPRNHRSICITRTNIRIRRICD